MPKPSNNKKRKRDKKKDEERGAKKAKLKDNEGVEEGLDLNAELNVADMPDKTEGVLDDIDELLEENAARNNLTAINVKSILHVSLCFSLIKDCS